MKVLFLSNNENSKKLYQWLEEQCEVIYCDKKINMDFINDILPDMIVSYNYKYIIGQDIIESMNGNVINLHISFLPWNRGSNPNFWSFVEHTPKGVTIHKISPKIDEGAIIYRKEVFFDEKVETFASTYKILNDEIVQLFIEHWDEIKERNYIETLQEFGGSYHNMNDFRIITEKCPVDWSENIYEYLRKIKSVV